MEEKQLVLNQYWLRLSFLTLKQRVAQHLFDQGLYPEHQKLQKEIKEDIKNAGLLLVFVEGCRILNSNSHIWN